MIFILITGSDRFDETGPVSTIGSQVNISNLAFVRVRLSIVIEAVAQEVLTHFGESIPAPLKNWYMASNASNERTVGDPDHARS